MGTVFSSALLAVGTHGGGVRWMFGNIRQTKAKGGRYKFRFFKEGIMGMMQPSVQISAPREDLVAQFGKKGRIIFLRLHKTKDGKSYSSFINFYEKFTVPPSTTKQTYEFLAPVNEDVVSWLTDECIETNNRYPFLIKNPHLASAAVFMTGLVCFVMMIVGLNMIL